MDRPGHSFEEMVFRGDGFAVILAGSGSDEPHIDKIADSLEEWEIPYKVRICSAHKQADQLVEVLVGYNRLEGSLVYVAVAGGTDALSGTASFHSRFPVISCPPDGKPSDPNMSCLTNPPGSSNAYISRPGNVGKFIAQMYSGVNPGLRKMLEDEKIGKIESLRVSDEEIGIEYLERQQGD